MPIDEQLLEILCCPVTKVPLEILSEEKQLELNNRIAQASVKNVDGQIVEEPIEEGLITENGETVYRVTDGIPIMLPGEGIPANQ